MNNEENHRKSFIESPFIKWFSMAIAFFGFCWICYDHIVENDPNLTFTIVKEISLLNNKANIPSIHILLDSIDISKTNSNLSIYTIKVENEGKQHISKDMYDGNIRLLLNKGEYISLPAITYASSTHIKPHFEDSTLIIDKNILKIPCVPMDKDNVYLFDVILRHPIDTLPSFSVHGKITGQKEINIYRGINDTQSFWRTTFGGGFLVNIVRILAYFLAGCVLIVIISTIIEKLILKIRKYKLCNAINKIVSRHSIQEQVVNDFKNLQKSELRLMYQWINTTDEEASRRYVYLQNKLKSRLSKMDLSIYGEENRIISQMAEKGYLSLMDQNIEINKSMQNDFKYIYKKLKKHNILNLDSFYP